MYLGQVHEFEGLGPSVCSDSNSSHASTLDRRA